MPACVVVLDECRNNLPNHVRCHIQRKRKVFERRILFVDGAEQLSQVRGRAAIHGAFGICRIFVAGFHPATEATTVCLAELAGWPSDTTRPGVSVAKHFSRAAVAFGQFHLEPNGTFLWAPGAIVP